MRAYFKTVTSETATSSDSTHWVRFGTGSRSHLGIDNRFGPD